MSKTKQSEPKQTATRKPNTRREPEPLPPALALEMLQSAARYCQQAGLPLTFETSGGELRLSVKGAGVEQSPEGVRFILTPNTAQAAEVSATV